MLEAGAGSPARFATAPRGMRSFLPMTPVVFGSLVHWMLKPDLEPLLDHGTPVFLAVVAGIVFAESGLLAGFFLPGDSLLFSAGLVAGLYARPNVFLLVVCAMVAAIVGDQVGYMIGTKAGPRIFRREESRFFRQEFVDRTSAFFDRHGARAIVLARFVPIVRTFTPVMAGVGSMRYRLFVTYNVIGGVLWATLATLLGWGLGKRFPKLENYLTPIAIVVIALSIIPMVFEVRRQRAHG
jgi:membrane-associated protein